MAITVTGANPTVVTVVSNTVTTNTTFNANAPNDRNYSLPGSLIGIVDPGVAVGGFGLIVHSSTVLAGARVDFTNNGFVTVDQGAAALLLRTDGGVVTYAGSGTVINLGTGSALSLVDVQGRAEATIAGTLIANTGLAANITGATGVTFAQTAGSHISNTIGSGADAVVLAASTGDIVVTLDGTISANLDAFDATSTSGNITVNFTGALAANAEEGIDTSTAGTTTINASGTIAAPRGIQAVGSGVGLVTVNVTAGQINTTSTGLELVSNGTGGVVVDMTGGQIGSSTQRAGGVGIIAQSNGTAGAVDLTVSSVWTTSTAILPSIGDATSDADITVTVNGTVDSLTGHGVSATNVGTGDILITNNGIINAGNLGLDLVVVGGSVHVFNAGTVNSTGGTAISFFSGNSHTLTLASTSVINGTVTASTGTDTLRLGGTAGTGTFDVSDIGAAQQYRDFEIFDVIGATWILTGTGTDAWTVLGGTLGGTATIGDLTVAGGTVAPGQSAGILTTGNLTFTGGSFAPEIGGTNPGAGHDQLAVTGAVALAGTLAPSLIGGFTPVLGTEFVIIANDGGDAVSGTFAGLAEDARFTAGGSGWGISYAGGDGNDVVLTAIGSLSDDVAPLGDVLWRNISGVVVTANAELGTAPPTFAIEQTGDFDHDGDSDILWRHDEGLTVIWELENGNYLQNHNLGIVPTTFRIAATGDTDGDGDSDIIWRHDDGLTVIWELEDHALVTNHNLPAAPTTFQIQGTGDFDRDGDADLLWRHDDGQVVIWELQGSTFVTNHNLPSAPTTFHIAATGDLDGDADADILWRHDDGAVVTWEIEDGAYVANHNLPDVPTTWQIEGTHDFDNDGDADILWRHDDGAVVTWEMENGAFVTNHNFGAVPTSWQISGTGEFDLA